MTKQTIKWHRDCLATRKDNLVRLLEERNRLLAKIADFERENEFYETQIKTAEDRKMEAFDRDRFLVKKAEKANIIL